MGQKRKGRGIAPTLAALLAGVAEKNLDSRARDAEAPPSLNLARPSTSASLDRSSHVGKLWGSGRAGVMMPPPERSGPERAGDSCAALNAPSDTVSLPSVKLSACNHSATSATDFPVG